MRPFMSLALRLRAMRLAQFPLFIEPCAPISLRGTVAANDSTPEAA
jgi:hypothetical protein